MTREEILAMEPGATLNVKVAQEIMGQRVIQDQHLGHVIRLDDGRGSSVWDVPQPYSEDVEAAQAVIDKMLEKGYEKAAYWDDFGAEAICKAALLAVLEGDGRASGG